MSNVIRVLVLAMLSSYLPQVIAAPGAEPAHTIAVVGMGGRSHYLLLECLRCSPNIRVVAVCDDHGAASFNWFARSLQRRSGALFNAYTKIFERAYLYPDTDEGIKKLFQENPQVDSVFITSSNDKHFKHLNAVLANSTCKNIYIEKPLFRTLEELQQFKSTKDDVRISVGLTLRYADMTKIVVKTLKDNQEQLGALKKVKSWERLPFGHALTIIMMNWRRSIANSGGLLLEKSIHDLDLGLFFIRSLNIDPQQVTINTEVAHRTFKKSQKKSILKAVAAEEELQNSIAGWCGVPFQRIIDFAADKKGYVDVGATIEKVFQDFPDNDNFKNSDIIPDYHKLTAICTTGAGNSVAFELEVDMSGLKLRGERGIRFEFEKGIVVVDIMESLMTITPHQGTAKTYDLQTQNSMHAGGDVYIAQLMLGLLPEDRYKATLNDDVVQVATYMGLISEQQAVGKCKQGVRIGKTGDKWMVQ